MDAPPAGEASVSIRGVSKAFGGARVLNAIDLDIRSGEFFSLLGPSGCGKTTLLRIIGGFESASDGAVLINGADVTDLPPYRRRTNMIFQHFALFPHLTVAQNIAFGLEMKRLDKRVVAEKVQAALDLVRLPDYGPRDVGKLSGGQKQRVAMARALINDPDVLLLDEPLGALDQRLREQMQEELRRLQRQTGKTFIFVTHDQSEAITMSDRIAVMSGGRLVQVGTPREVYEQPAERFVAEFLGSSNLIQGTVSAVTGGRAEVRVRDVAIEGVARAPLSPGDPVVIGVRFERVRLSAADATPAALTGAVTGCTYVGATTRYELDSPQLGRIVAETPSGDGPTFAIGDTCRIRWAAGDASILAA